MNVKQASVITLVVAALATFFGVIWWSTRGNDDAPVAVTLTDARTKSLETPQAPASGSVTVTPAKEAAGPAVDEDAAVSEAGFRDYVNAKYRFLFRNITMTPEAQEALLAALLERERIAALIRTARQSREDKDWEAVPRLRAELAAIEQKIGSLLPPASINAFDLLKESDREQYQLEDYAGGISNVAPVSEDDKQSIIMTKLTHRQRFQSALEESRLLTGELSPEQRKLAFKDVSRALKASRDGYLREVRQYLYNDEQFQYLSNYENTEYETELESLRRVAYGE